VFNRSGGIHFRGGLAAEVPAQLRIQTNQFRRSVVDSNRFAC
jgi:hypothetical protein